MMFLWARDRFGKDGIETQLLQKSPQPLPKRELLRTLAKESLPITIAALAMNLNPFIDMLTIPNLVNDAGGQGNFVFGSYTGIAIPIFAIATTLTALVCKSALPEITTAYCERNAACLKSALSGLFKGTFVVGLPVCFGIAVLAEPILSLLYFSRPEEVAVSTLPLMVLGFGGTSLLLAGALFGIFLSIGRADLQVKLMLGGATIKLAGNLLLVRIPEIGVTGAAIATLVCYGFVSLAGLIALQKCLKPLIPKSPLKSLKIHKHFVQSLLFSAKCAATAYFCYHHLFADSDLVAWLVVHSEFLRLAMSVAAGGIVYLSAVMFADRGYVRECVVRVCGRKG
jgi:stage V sporulation protein B